MRSLAEVFPAVTRKVTSHASTHTHTQKNTQTHTHNILVRWWWPRFSDWLPLILLRTHGDFTPFIMSSQQWSCNPRVVITTKSYINVLNLSLHRLLQNSITHWWSLNYKTKNTIIVAPWFQDYLSSMIMEENSSFQGGCPSITTFGLWWSRTACRHRRLVEVSFKGCAF